MWGAGRFMHFGESVEDDRFIGLIHLADQLRLGEIGAARASEVSRLW